MKITEVMYKKASVKKFVELDNEFQNEYNDEFEVYEIIREYERREEENTNKNKKNMHYVAWFVSLAALSVALLMGVKGASPLQVVTWLSIVVLIMLVKLIPEALTCKPVYNDDME